MLAAKSTVKERWRQILEEADRISIKHFCTLDQKITAQTLHDIGNAQIQLVIPQEIITTYYVDQAETMMNLSEFISYVQNKQDEYFN